MPESERPHPLHVYWTCPRCPTEDRNVSINATRCPRCQYPLDSWRPDTGLPIIEALNANRNTIGELEYREAVMIWVYIDGTLTTGPTMNDSPADLEAWFEAGTNGATTNGATTNGGTTYVNNTDGDITDEDTAYAGRTNGGRPNGVTTNGGTTNGARTNGSTTNGARTNGTRTNGATTNRNQERR